MRIKPPSKATLRVFAVAITAVMCTLVILSAVFPFPEGQWDFLSIGTSQKALANPGWLSGWSYRMSHVVNNATGAGVNYTIPITIRTVATQEVSSNGATEWFQNRFSAVYYSGTYNRTYFSWVDNTGKCKITYYDHANTTWASAVTVKDWAHADDHESPTLLILPDGKILFFDECDYQPLYCWKSTNAEDISSWGTNVTIDPDNTPGTDQPTYSFPVRTTDGTIWCFYRKDHGTQHKTFGYRTSSDNGTTWSSYTTIADFGYPYWAYGIVAKGTDDSIHVMLNPYSNTDAVRRKIGYMYTTNGSTWMKRDGTNITLPATEATMDVVYDYGSNGYKVWEYDLKLDSSDDPFMTFVTDVDSITQHGRWAGWNGTSWNTYSVCDTYEFYTATGSHYSSGLVIDPTDVYTIYAAAKVSGENRSEIERWISSDTGVTWNKSLSVTSGSTYSQVRPQMVQNYNSEMPLWWMNLVSYNSYNDWSATLIVYDSTPPIQDCSSGTIYIPPAHVRDDLGDVRFTDNDGVTLLDYWQQGNQFWVEVADSLESSAQTIDIYYGKSDATTASNGTNTFILFDDFERGSDGDTVGGSWTEAAAHCHISTEQKYGGTRGAKLIGSTAGAPQMTIPRTVGDAYAIRMRLYKETAAVIYPTQHGNGTKTTYWKIDASEDVWYYDTAWKDTGDNIAADTWQLLELRDFVWASYTYDIVVNDVLAQDNAGMLTSALYPNIVHAEGSTTGNGHDFWIDDFIIRKYTSPEPTHGSCGSEETFAVEITNTPDSKDFGVLAVNTTSNTNINYFTLNNTGNCAVDITIQGTNLTGGDDTWTLSGTATPGENIYGLYAGLDDADDNFDVVVNTTANAFVADLPDGSTQAWGLKIYMPTSVTGYDAQEMSGTITLIASEA